MGLFRNDGPQPWHPANNDLKEKIKECIEMCNQRGEFCQHRQGQIDVGDGC